MEEDKEIEPNEEQIQYELQPPDGGWGYIVTAALTLGTNVSLVPMAAFGLIYGQFLSSIGDETTGTTLTNGIFNTVFNFTGLIANGLLQKYSYRVVGLIGAFLFCLGHFAMIFVTDLWQMIVSFGVIQGLGMGLLFPALFTALNCYFNKKLNLMNSLAQTIMILTTMAFPSIIKFLMDKYGYRGTVAILSALSLNTVLAAVALQPIECYLVKKPTRLSNNGVEAGQLETLLELNIDNNIEKYILPKPRPSIISIGDRALSVTTINRIGKPPSYRTSLQSLMKYFDLSLFKDWVYVNITVGLSLSFTADITFNSIIPLVLNNAGFNNGEITLLLTIYFGGDVAGRILLLVLNALFTIKNRYFFLGGAFFNVIFRTVFLIYDTLLWKMSTLVILGFLRAFIQTPLPCVISDQYSKNFATAFSLYMVVCGLCSLIFGPLMSWIKVLTDSDVMVVHLLTLAYLICTVTWIIELLIRRNCNK